MAPLEIPWVRPCTITNMMMRPRALTALLFPPPPARALRSAHWLARQYKVPQ